MNSAFGIDHGSEFSKKNKRPKKDASGLRLAGGALFAPVHGVVAGKGAKNKLKAGALEAATTAGVGLSAAGVDRRLAAPGAMLGGAAGARLAHNSGWLKKENQ